MIFSSITGKEMHSGAALSLIDIACYVIMLTH